MDADNFIEFLNQFSIIWSEIDNSTKELFIHKYLNDELSVGVFTDLSLENPNSVVLTYNTSSSNRIVTIELNHKLEDVSNQIEAFLESV